MKVIHVRCESNFDSFFAKDIDAAERHLRQRYEDYIANGDECLSFVVNKLDEEDWEIYYLPMDKPDIVQEFIDNPKEVGITEYISLEEFEVIE